MPKQTKVKREIGILRSETFFSNCTFRVINEILEECINDFLDPNDKIINIEKHEESGLYRFWIYYETLPTTKRK